MGSSGSKTKTASPSTQTTSKAPSSSTPPKSENTAESKTKDSPQVEPVLESPKSGAGDILAEQKGEGKGKGGSLSSPPPSSPPISSTNGKKAVDLKGESRESLKEESKSKITETQEKTEQQIAETKDVTSDNSADQENQDKPKPNMAAPIPDDDKKKKKGNASEETEDERVIQEASQHQIKMDVSLRSTNLLVKQDGLLSAANQNVTKLALRRALPRHVSLHSLVGKLGNLQVLDVSKNELGPQAVRLLCLALPPTCPIASLSIADNKTDTDTAESIGRLLTSGPPLVYLDVSSNYLGKDFFSRCVGQALKTNTTLQTLRAQSIGMVDAKALLEGLEMNTCLVELDLSNNQITDRQALGDALSAVLKKPECCLQSLALAGCNMNAAGLTKLTQGVAANTSLLALNLNNNEFGQLQTLLEMVSAACCHPTLNNLHLNDAKLNDFTCSDLAPPSDVSASSLEVWSLHSSNVTDEFFAKLAAIFQGKLLRLVDVDLSNNSKLTANSVQHVHTLSADDSGQSHLLKLTAAMTEMNGLPALLTATRFPRLSYLNTRKVRFSPDSFSALADLISPDALTLTTLVLDGIKLSGKKGLVALFGNCPSSKLTALSLSGCSLTDADLTPLAEALGSGFMLHMIKLSANRLTDTSLTTITDKVLKCRTHPLGVLDISENQITDAGVKDLCRVYTTKSHSSSLHSVNLANNSVGKEGILSLLSCMGGKFPLKCLYVNSQSASFLESDTEEIYVKVASVLGYTVKKSGETIEIGCGSLPSLPNGLSLDLRGLGGHAGELGPFLDCPAIVTDASTQRLMTLTLENVLDICCSLQGQKSGQCRVSREDWIHITGSDKDNSIPSWLQLEESRKRGVYLSNLPGNATSQRLESMFESEADCNIEEVFMVKDPVTKNNSGTAWVLFSDEPSVTRAMDLYSSGQAVVFGTPFTISRLLVNVDESVSSDASDKARQELAARQRARVAEDRAHRRLIQQNTEESWKRHAYRLAHPAYADGRIW